MGSSAVESAASAQVRLGPVAVKKNEFDRLVWTRIPLVVILAAGAVLERLDVALAGAHKVVEGRPSPVSGGFGDIAIPARLVDPASALAIANGWNSLIPVAGPLILAYGVFDLILMVVLSVWLNTLYRRRLRVVEPEKAPGRWKLPLPIVGYLVADFAETATLVCCWKGLSTLTVYFIAGASLVKWFFLGISILMIALRYRLPVPAPAPGAAGDSPPDPAGPPQPLKLRWVILALRGQLLVVVVLIGILLMLFGELGRQVDEVLVLAAARVWPAAFATGFAVVATLILAFGGMACLRAYLDFQPQPPDPGQVKHRTMVAFVVLALGFVLFVISWVVSTDIAAAILTWAIPAGFIGVVLLQARYGTLAASAATPPSLSEVVTGREWIVLMLADVPMLAIFLAIARAATTVATADHPPGALIMWGFVVAIVWFAVHVVLLAWVQGKTWNNEGYVNKMLFITLAAGVFLLGCAFLPGVLGYWIPFYQGMGTPAILMAFATIIGLLLTGLTLLSDRFRPGGALDAFGIKRVPIFTGFLIWGLLAASIDSVGAYYVVRANQKPPERTSAETAFGNWTTANATEPGTVPLVFVAAAGGGIRAAYWTRLGMDCVFGTDCGGTDHTDQVFLASGVSGGSLGLVSTRSEQQAERSAERAIDKVLGEDFIAPSLAAFLFADQANSFLRWPVHAANRADTLELAWEQADPGLAESFGTATVFPRLVLNSTSVEDGCRLEVAELRFGDTATSEAWDPRSCTGDVSNLGAAAGPGVLPTRDAFAYLCEGDAARGLSLSTAALMSARFPYVSPTGGLRGCGKPPQRTFALDGGIYDNSGGTAALEAWQAVSKAVSDHNATLGAVCIVPRLVVFDSARVVGLPPQVDNRPQQAGAPLVAALGGFDRRSSTPLARAAQAIQEGADKAAESCHLAKVDAIAVIAPNEQPGPGLPLGWTLSEETRSQMRCQLGGRALVATGPIKDWNCDPAITTDELTDVKKVQSWFR